MRRLFPAVLLVAACADAQRSEDPLAPAVLGLDKSSLVVGETLWFSGKNLKGGESGRTRLHFRGQYTTTSGERSPVGFAITPLVEERPDGTVTARWTRFGPFRNPFRDDGAPGVFEGQIIAEVEDAQQHEVRADPHPRSFSLAVGPSILVERLEPLDAKCGAPAVRGLAGLAYQLQARATGITPVRWAYAIGEVDGASGLSSFEHDSDPSLPAGTDVLGDGPDEPLIFNPVPESDQFYPAAIRIAAWDAAGNVAETALPLTVHRPIEVSADGKMVVAERYEPVPVSGCIMGSVQSRITYSETTTEYRQRSVSLTVEQTFAERNGTSRTESWDEGITTGETASRTVGERETEAETLSESHGVTRHTS